MNLSHHNSRSSGGPADNSIQRRNFAKPDFRSSLAAIDESISGISRKWILPKPLLVAVLIGVTAPAWAAVQINWVNVANPGNGADTNGYGAVASEFLIMRYEWTNAQYVEFLNAIDPDGTNPNGVYNPSMGSDARGGISFTFGAAKGSKYAVKTNMGNKPVGYASWFDAARVANWLHHGGQTYASTDATASAPQNTGAYPLGTATSGSAPAKNGDAKYWIPTENEWYKAAFYKANPEPPAYTLYGNGYDTTPTAVTANTTGDGSAGGTGNFANYNRGADWNGQDGNLTTVGTNGAANYYGAFDMSGNSWEWNDLDGASNSNRGLRGGSYPDSANNLDATSLHVVVSADLEGNNNGFRLATPPPCGSGIVLTISPTSLWQQLALPCVPGTPTVGTTLGANVTGLLDASKYNKAAENGWLMYGNDLDNNSNLKLTVGDTLSNGTGYWIKSFSNPVGGGSLAVSGDAPAVQYAGGCAVNDGCKAIAVRTVTGQDRYNLIGNPFPYDVDWAQVRVRVTAQDGETVIGTYTPSQAAGVAASGNASPPVMSNAIWIYSGTQYETWTDVSVPHPGNLKYFQSFWVKVYAAVAANNYTVELLIPAKASTHGQLAPAGDTRLAETNLPWYLAWLDRLIDPAAADEPEDFGTTQHPGTHSAEYPTRPFPQLAAPAAANSGSRPKTQARLNAQGLDPSREWYVSLRVDEPATGYKDHNSVIGQLLTAQNGYDPRDLVELAPFGKPFMTLVFPHPEWGPKAGDAQAAMLWDLHASGLNAAHLTELVSERFGLAPARVRDNIDNQLRLWRQAGLLDTRPELACCADNNPTLEEATPKSYPLSAAWRLRVADREVDLYVADAALRQRLRPWFPSTTSEDCAGPVDHYLHLTGHAGDWRLSRDGHAVAAGQTLDAALLAILTALTGLACRPAEHLLIAHGTGLVTPGGDGLLLVAPGGSGKTTLAAAFNADGLALLHDDVVPIDLDGRLLGLGTPMALKAGSWPILAIRRPELASWPITERHDQPVRLLPPLGQAPRNPVAPAALLFPGHRPGIPLLRERLSPEQALQGLVNSETVIRELSQAKLERLARWVESVPAWSLTYPDLDQGLAGVRAILADTATL